MKIALLFLVILLLLNGCNQIEDIPLSQSINNIISNDNKLEIEPIETLDDFSCNSDSDCKIDVCSENFCLNKDFERTEELICAIPLELQADYCKCEENFCIGYKAAGGPEITCGNQICEEWELTVSHPGYCPEDCQDNTPPEPCTDDECI